MPTRGQFPTGRHVWLCRVGESGLDGLPEEHQHSARRRLNLCQVGQIVLTLLRPSRS